MSRRRLIARILDTPGHQLGTVGLAMRQAALVWVYRSQDTV